MTMFNHDFINFSWNFRAYEIKKGVEKELQGVINVYDEKNMVSDQNRKPVNVVDAFTSILLNAN